MAEIRLKAANLGITPVEVMVENMRYFWRKRRKPEFRLLAQKCANDAAPYLHPRLNAINADVHTTLSIEDDPIDELLAEVSRRRQALRNGEDNDPVVRH
jgi:hypothetical protein